MNKYCNRGVKPEIIMQVKLDPDFKCDRFVRLSLNHIAWLYPNHGIKDMGFDYRDKNLGKCIVCEHNRALRSKGLP